MSIYKDCIMRTNKSQAFVKVMCRLYSYLPSLTLPECKLLLYIASRIGTETTYITIRKCEVKLVTKMDEKTIQKALFGLLEAYIIQRGKDDITFHVDPDIIYKGDEVARARSCAVYNKMLKIKVVGNTEDVSC